MFIPLEYEHKGRNDHGLSRALVNSPRVQGENYYCKAKLYQRWLLVSSGSGDDDGELWSLFLIA